LEEEQMPLEIAVIGTGHVGLITAGTLARVGHTVIGVDDDQDKIESLRGGRMPFFEAGLSDLVAQEMASGRLRFTRDVTEAVAQAQVAFICVGTPGRPSGEPNMLAVEGVATALGRAATHDMVVVEKSTVPVQTADRIRTVLARTSPHAFHVASNPEFLREGRAVEDSLHPDRILVGADNAWAHGIMRTLYEPMIEAGARYFATDVSTAELAKHACNAFLALKISFANGLARVCEASGADVVAVADIMGSDRRIGRDFLNAGLGWGGSCFPKDLAAFRAQSTRLGYQFGLLDEVVKINDEALESAFNKIKDVLWNLEGKRVLLLGLAFKPGTDDVRESPALRLAQMLLDGGATVLGVDPEAGPAAAAELEGLEVVDDVYAAAEGADCLVVCTEWPEFADLDLVRLKGILTVPILVDGRNLFDAEAAREAGFSYFPTGRPAFP
jgi:UDPglucose 6-dehydrogenase